MANAPQANGGVSARRRRGSVAMKERAKRRVGELEGMLAALQAARRESRPTDAACVEDRAIGMLRGWRAELDRPATASSSSSSASQHHRRCLAGNSHGSSDLSSYIRRMLQLNEEDVEDDATSKHVEPPPVANPKAEPLEPMGAECTEINGGVPAAFFEGLPDHGFGIAGFKHLQEDTTISFLEESYLAPSQQLVAIQTACLTFLPAEAMSNGEHATPLLMSGAFLRPKCALWDCPRPAQGMEWYHDYCSGFHANLALSEGPPGMTAPVLRPGGIDLKDGPLFAALLAKTQGKSVGIPECPGAATTRSPWNAPELFDLSVLTGESLREWLFFDKPRRAFESGNRKQRSLPDYAGRGWHESRKQVLAEHGGLKRSYYMDPQPLIHYEWHLYEYEMSGYDACALYRLELKLAGPKKAGKGKAKSTPPDKDSLKELEQQLYSTAELAYGGLSYGYTVDSFADLYAT